MKILNILGKVGAAAAAVAGLVLAGKTGFGENLFSSKDEDGVATDDLTNPEVPEETSEVVEEVETTADEEETPE
jgi:hypothetical protein